MKPLLVVPIVVSLLVLGQVSCWRKKPANINANLVAASDGTAEGQRTQARALVDQGKNSIGTTKMTKRSKIQGAIKLNSELAEAHFRLGMTYDAVGMEQEAEGLTRNRSICTEATRRRQQ